MATKIRKATGIASTGLGLALPLLGVNPIAAGAIAGGVGLVGLVDKIGQGRRTANKMTDPGAPQDIINKQLAAISSSNASPEEKAQATDKAWRDFLSATTEFGSQGPTFAKVAQQAIFQTPELTNTVKSLLGGKDPLDPAYVSQAQQGIATGQGKPNEQGIGGTLLQSGLAAATPYIMGKVAPQGGARTSSGSGSPSLADIQGGIVPELPTLARNGAAKATGGGISGILDSIFSKKNIPDLLSAGTSLVGSVLQGRAANNAANMQAGAADRAARLQTDAATRAAQLQSDAAKNSLDFAKQVYGDQQKANAPFLEAGTNALAEVQKLLAPGGDLSKPFTAPTAEEVRATPGYQLKLDEAMKALQRSTRGVTNGATVKSAIRFADDYADSAYGTATDRALKIFQTNRDNRLNPLLQVAGYGPNAVAANNQSGNNAERTNTDILTTTANNLGNLDTSTARNVGDIDQNAAQLRASGYRSGQNALTDALQAISNLAQQRQLMQQLGRG